MPATTFFVENDSNYGYDSSAKDTNENNCPNWKRIAAKVML